MKNCTHPSFHFYSSTNQKQCTVCKEVFNYKDNAGQTTHKRVSTI